MQRLLGEPWSAQLRERAKAREGATWDEWLRRQLRVLARVCDAIAFAHDAGIVHRDLKPENVIVGRHGEVYVIDWGLAVESPHEPEPGSNFTGTPAYVAPEMVLQGDVDPRTDVYLLGAVLHEILTCEPPHAAPTVVEAFRSAVRTDGCTLPDEVPRTLGAVCHRAMRREPSDRFASASELGDALLAAIDALNADDLVREAHRIAAPLVEGPITAPCDHVRATYASARVAYELARRVSTDRAPIDEAMARGTLAPSPPGSSSHARAGSSR